MIENIQVLLNEEGQYTFEADCTYNHNTTESVEVNGNTYHRIVTEVRSGKLSGLMKEGFGSRHFENNVLDFNVKVNYRNPFEYTDIVERYAMQQGYPHYSNNGIADFICVLHKEKRFPKWVKEVVTVNSRFGYDDYDSYLSINLIPIILFEYGFNNKLYAIVSLEYFIENHHKTDLLRDDFKLYKYLTEGRGIELNRINSFKEIMKLLKHQIENQDNKLQKRYATY